MCACWCELFVIIYFLIYLTPIGATRFHTHVQAHFRSLESTLQSEGMHVGKDNIITTIPRKCSRNGFFG